MQFVQELERKKADLNEQHQTEVVSWQHLISHIFCACVNMFSISGCIKRTAGYGTGPA